MIDLSVFMLITGKITNGHSSRVFSLNFARNGTEERRFKITQKDALKVTTAFIAMDGRSSSITL